MIASVELGIAATTPGPLQREHAAQLPFELFKGYHYIQMVRSFTAIYLCIWVGNSSFYVIALANFIFLGIPRVHAEEPADVAANLFGSRAQRLHDARKPREILLFVVSKLQRVVYMGRILNFVVDNRRSVFLRNS